MRTFIYITSIFGAIAVYQVLGWTLNRKLYFFPGLQEQSTSNWAVETTEIYCLTVLEVRSYDQGVSRLTPEFLLRVVWEDLLQASFLTPGVAANCQCSLVPWLVEASPRSLPSSSHGIFSVCFSEKKYPPSIRT